MKGLCLWKIMIACIDLVLMLYKMANPPIGISHGAPTPWILTILHGRTFFMSAKCYHRCKLVYRTLCKSWDGHGLMRKRNEKRVTWSPHPLPNDGVQVDTLDHSVLSFGRTSDTASNHVERELLAHGILFMLLGTIFSS